MRQADDEEKQIEGELTGFLTLRTGKPIGTLTHECSFAFITAGTSILAWIGSITTT